LTGPPVNKLPWHTLLLHRSMYYLRVEARSVGRNFLNNGPDEMKITFSLHT